MINKTFIFLDETSTSTTSNILAIINNDLMVLEVSSTTNPVGAVSVVIYGKTDINSTQWTTLAAINASTLKVVETISSSGNYFLPVTGISQVYVTSTTTAGDTKVYAKLAV